MFWRGFSKLVYHISSLVNFQKVNLKFLEFFWNCEGYWFGSLNLNVLNALYTIDHVHEMCFYYDNSPPNP